MCFYVSGSIGAVGASSPEAKASLFGGDLVVSGGLFIGEQSSSPWTPTGDVGVLYVKEDSGEDHLYYKASGVSEVKLSEHTAAGASEAFKTITVSGEDNVVADTATVQ